MALKDSDLFAVYRESDTTAYHLKASNLQLKLPNGDSTNNTLVWNGATWVPGPGSTSLWTEDSGKIYPINTSNDVLIGGTLPSAPNISLYADGTAVYRKDIKVAKDMTLGHGAGDIASNLAFGSYALNNNTSGTNNVAVGSSALANNDDALGNTAVGNQAMIANTSGGSNTGIGHLVLKKATTASSNTAVGKSALANTTTGSQNVGIGRDALSLNETGVGNVAIGRRAGWFIEGSNNTVLGSIQGTANDSTLNDTVIISAGPYERLRIDSTGSLLFGGTLPSAPNITLNAAGNGTFQGIKLPNLLSTDSLGTDSEGNIIAGSGGVSEIDGGIYA